MNPDQIERAIERAEVQLERDLDEGLISATDFNAGMRDLARDYREMMNNGAAEAAEAWRDGR